MPVEQLEALYHAFVVGFLRNNYIPPKEEDILSYDKRLKRLFRTFCKANYDFDPITAEYMNPDKWMDWTWRSLQFVIAEPE